MGTIDKGVESAKLFESYRRLKCVSKAAREVGICEQGAHERIADNLYSTLIILLLKKNQNIS